MTKKSCAPGIAGICANAVFELATAGVRILNREAQGNLAEYVARPPIPPPHIRYEPFEGRVLFHTAYSEYFQAWTRG